MLTKINEKVKKATYHKLLEPNNYNLDYVQLNLRFPIIGRRNKQHSNRYIQTYEYKATQDFITQLCGIKGDDNNIGLIKKQINYWTDKKILGNQLTDYNSESITILPDLRHFNIKIHFSGRFFLHDKIKKDLMQVDLLINKIHNAISVYWKGKSYTQYYNEINENNFDLNFLRKIDVPEFTVSRFDLCRNDQVDDLLYNPMFHCNFKKYRKTWNDEYYILKNSRGTYQNLDTKVTSKISNHGSSSMHFSAYVKKYDILQRQIHSQLRFGKLNYIRREWKFKTKKIRNMGIAFWKDLRSALFGVQSRMEIIKRMRLSFDITFPKDDSSYIFFHKIGHKDFAELNEWLFINKGIDITKEELEKFLRNNNVLPINKNQIPENHQITDEHKRQHNPLPQLIGLLKSPNLRANSLEDLLIGKRLYDRQIQMKLGNPYECDLDLWKSHLDEKKLILELEEKKMQLKKKEGKNQIAKFYKNQKKEEKN